MEPVKLNKIAWDVWAAESASVKQLIGNTDYGALNRVYEAILHCVERRGNVLTTGAGTSGAAAVKIAHTFSCVGIPAFFLAPAEALHGGLGAVREEDVVIAISKGGDTAELLQMLPALKAKGATLVGVTEKETSPLGAACDIVLRVRVEREPDPYNMLATASTLAVLAVFDALAIALMHATGYTKEQFSVNHPGGEVGKRLKAGE